MPRENDDALIGREQAIPGMRYLLDPGRLKKLVVQSGAIDIPGDLREGYLRYKPGVNCIARFTFAANGQTHYAYAKAFGQDADSKISKTLERTDPGSSFGRGRVVFRQEQILFSVFPVDAKLRSLEKLQHEATRTRLLDRLFKSHTGWTSATFKPLNYKPERRFVAQFTHADGRSATVKFYSGNEFSKVREFRKHLETTPGVKVPEWIGGSKAHHALAFSWLPGTTLREHRGDGQLDAIRLTGATLARFHQGRQHRFRALDAAQLAQRPMALSDGLAAVLPERSAQAFELARDLAEWKSNSSGPLRPVHGDFYDKQVLVNDGQVALIDCDNAHLGNPLDDIACYIAHLERNAINHGMASGDIPVYTSALLEGYGEVSPGLALDKLEQHIAWALFQLAHNPFRDRVDDWPSQTCLLLDRCRALFSAG